jgi:hypothetical protein
VGEVTLLEIILIIGFGICISALLEIFLVQGWRPRRRVPAALPDSQTFAELVKLKQNELARVDAGGHTTIWGLPCDETKVAEVIPGESLGATEVTGWLCLRCGADRPKPPEPKTYADGNRLRPEALYATETREYVPAPFFNTGERDDERAWIGPDQVPEPPRPEDANSEVLHAAPGELQPGGMIHTGKIDATRIIAAASIPPAVMGPAGASKPLQFLELERKMLKVTDDIQLMAREQMRRY